MQTLYLWPSRRSTRSELEVAKADQAADKPGAARRIDQAEGPYRNGVYDPVLDDGVKVNITPLQEAGVLRYRKVV